ncbi:MAG: CDP-alcohol phosphatidyltransferase family protein [Nitrospinae bacterium]|nr:CDP-alcohol phosphatidyltransferase family protein [Nitrospinota bacterium]
MLRRVVLAAVRAGIGQILVLTPDASEARRLLDGAPALVLTPDGPLPALPPGRMVLLAMNILPHPKWLRSLFEMSIEPERLYVEASSVAMIEAADSGAILAVVSHCHGAPDLFRALERVFKTERLSLGEAGKFVLATHEDIPRAEGWLLRGLVKETESFMSRHVERRISLAITRRLASTRMTPNAMTLVSIAVGLMGAPFFLSSSSAYQLTGALLFLAHSILDGCDGELARLKFLESRRGGLLDFWGDNIVHVAVFMGMAIGWSLASRAMWPLLVGGVAAAGTLLSASFVYRHTMQEKATDAPLFTSVTRTQASGLSRVADTLARRDFIYLVVLLSAMGEATWFLILAAVGSPLFFLVLLWIAHTEAHQEGNLP